MWQSGGSKRRRGPASLRGRGGYGVPAHLRWLQGRTDLDKFDEERFHDSLFFQIYIFEEPNFEGDFIEYTGPTIMPDPKYQFGVSHQSLAWLNSNRNHDNSLLGSLDILFLHTSKKHQANKKMMIEVQKEKKTTNVLVGLRIAQQSDALSSVLPLVLPAGSF